MMNEERDIGPWKVEQGVDFTLEQLEAIADGLEDGDIVPGGIWLNLPINHGLPPELLARLKPVLGRFRGSMRIK